MKKASKRALQALFFLMAVHITLQAPKKLPWRLKLKNKLTSMAKPIPLSSHLLGSQIQTFARILLIKRICDKRQKTRKRVFLDICEVLEKIWGRKPAKKKKPIPAKQRMSAPMCQ